MNITSLLNFENQNNKIDFKIDYYYKLCYIWSFHKKKQFKNNITLFKRKFKDIKDSMKEEQLMTFQDKISEIDNYLK